MDPFVYGDPNCDHDANIYLDFVEHKHPDSHADFDGEFDRDRFSDIDTDWNLVEHVDLDPNSKLDFDAYSFSNADAYGFNFAHGHMDIDYDTKPDGYDNRHSNHLMDIDDESVRHILGDSNSHTFAVPDHDSYLR